MKKKPLKILALRPHTTVKAALREVSQMDMSDVIVVGYNREGDLVTRSSSMSHERALYLLEQSKLASLGK